VTTAGLGVLTPHALRHTAASLAISAGAHVVAVSHLLGHASPNVTLAVYSHLFADALDNIAAGWMTPRSVRGTHQGLAGTVPIMRAPSVRPDLR
jgi:integrase